jgi:hypothetical protein
MLRSPEPTAEQVVQATEAAFLLAHRADMASVARFMSLDVSIEHQRRQVEHALLAAEMLELITPRSRNRRGYDFSPLVSLIVKAGSQDKRILFRIHLDQFEPFVLFVERLRTGIQPQQAAHEAYAVRDFADDPLVAWRAFESWGTYSGSLARADDGRYAPADPGTKLSSVRRSLRYLSDQAQDARQIVLEYLGPVPFRYIEGRVRDALVDAIVMYANENQPENIILRIGNTYEDFLRRVGYRRVDLRNSSGIIQIGNQLRNRRLIAQKHLGAVQLIGQIRNATEHGGDPDEGNRCWQVTSVTVNLMILGVLSSIRSIALYRESAALEL